MRSADLVNAFKANLAKHMAQAKGEVMNNQPDDMRPFETDEASDVKRPSDEEIQDYVDDNCPGYFQGVTIAEDDGDGVWVIIDTYIPYAEVEV